MADDAFRPSWATPSIEFVIRLWRSPKQQKAFGGGPITDELRQFPHTYREQ